MKESPAPTVSATTMSGFEGTSRRSPEAVRASEPRLPRVRTTMATPVFSQVRATDSIASSSCLSRP